MSNEIENSKTNGYSWIAWGLTIIVIVLTLQIMSTEADTPGSNEFYEHDNRKSTRIRPSVSRPKPAPALEEASLQERPKPGFYNMDYSAEYNAKHGQREMKVKKQPKHLGEHEVLWR